MYQREIPRDLFNESKLLKCLGQLALVAHDGFDPVSRKSVPRTFTAEVDDDSGFIIDQRIDDGSLYVSSGVVFKIRSLCLQLYSRYNCKSPYPLMFEDDDGFEYSVFNDDGSLTVVFLDHLELHDKVLPTPE